MKTNDIASALERELGGSFASDKVEPGYRTKREWMKIWNKSCSGTKIILNQHIESGRMVQKMIKILTTCGRKQPIPHYKAVK